MIGSITCRYEVTYALERARSRHERWLTSWALAWIECTGVRTVEVGRTDLDGTVEVQVLIDLDQPCDVTERGESHAALFERLREEVADPRIHCVPA